MDHTAPRKRPSIARVHKYLPYLAHQAVSKIQSDIWCSSVAVLCIDTSRPKWNLWTSLPWAWPIDMPSKLSRSLNKRRDNLGLGTPRSKNQERADPTYRTKDREKITFSLLKVVPHVKDWWETFCEKKEIEEPSIFTVATT